MIAETFSKSERLCSKKLISELFEKGNSFYHNGFQTVWIIPGRELPAPAQIAISVSRKTFRRAVVRNLIKRRIREVYRKNKHLLYKYLEQEETGLTFILIYKGTTVPDYRSVERSVTESLGKLIDSVKASSHRADY